MIGTLRPPCDRHNEAASVVYRGDPCSSAPVGFGATVAGDER